ncbi:MAG: bacillithiol biosynthesis cysteine-adding enzyme BshC [Saprospiraceae bacterium]
MQITRIPFDQVTELSKKDSAYATGDTRLRPFYQYEVALESFKAVMEDKQKQAVDRETLVEVLSNQYDKLTDTKLQLQQIEKLKAKHCYTVTTAHQPSLFTGPLYYIYKIASTINLSRQLAKAYPDRQFVPIFVTGGEDHDFEEINHLHLFNKTITWENKENGAVGAMHTASLAPIIEEVQAILGSSENATALVSMLRKTYLAHDRFGAATIAFTHELFKSTELVILDMNTPALKRLFVPIMKEELLQQVSQPFIEAAAAQLNELGFKAQAFPREINLFYLQNQSRERIVLEDEQYKILNTDLVFTKTALLEEMEKHPERFSPNVIMRPLYQELILPNLAYIGGGGEIAYWLERKAQFEHFALNFPMLIRRNSVLWLDKGMTKRMDKLGITSKDLFRETSDLVKAFVHEQAEEDLNIKKEKAIIDAAYESISQIAKKVDPTLEKAILAEQTRQLKTLDQLEGRIVRAEKKKHETALSQIESLKEKLFPNLGLQERHDNFMGFYLKYGQDFLDSLVKELSPLEKGFMVIQE